MFNLFRQFRYRMGTMIRPCERVVKCFPCADEASNPFANLSAEKPDLNIFLSVQFRRVPNPPPNNWGTTVCNAFCESSVSQEDADDCARRKAFECIVDYPPPDPRRPDWPEPIACNQVQTCQQGDDCYTIPAGTVCAFSAIEAAAIAESLCNHRVRDPDLTEACPAVAQPPTQPTPEQPCPDESGSPAPDSLEISSQQSWETHGLDNSTLLPFVSSHPECNPTSVHIYTPVTPIDHPPGNYGLMYIDGHFHFTGAAYCQDVPGFPYNAGAHVSRLQNELHNYDNCDAQGALAFSFHPGTGWVGCFENQAAGEADIHANLDGKVFRTNPYPPDEIFGFPHTNDGGSFSLITSDSSFDPSGIQSDVPTFPAGPMQFLVVQIEGLIPQPRKVAIEDYAALVSQFADPVGAAAWNGEFSERTVYNEMTVQWAVTAAGPFGGALLRWTDAHPTSANGKGWMLELFSPGSILMWRGFRAIGATPIGRFHKDSTSTPDGPACVECVDDSDQPWQP